MKTKKQIRRKGKFPAEYWDRTLGNTLHQTRKEVVVQMKSLVQLLTILNEYLLDRTLKLNNLAARVRELEHDIRLYRQHYRREFKKRNRRSLRK